MIDSNPAGDVIALLSAAMDAPELPPRAREAGARLLERLTSPIRLVILGHPHSGKSQVLNLLAGETVVPDRARVPTLELVYGDTRRMTLCLSDGTEEPRDSIALDKVRRTDIELIRVEAPLPILKKISLLEVVSRGTAEDEKENVIWAAERADIVLWCSQEFTPAEQWLWSAMPDRLKDHGFLVLTKADQLIRQGILMQRIKQLEDIVAEEFHSLLPVATLQGIAARSGEDGTDEAALAASGAKALIASILRHVEQGRRADLDGALMFLNRFGSSIPTPRPAPAPVRSPAPAPEAPAQKEAPPAAQWTEAIAAPAGEFAPEPEDLTVTAPVAEQSPELQTAETAASDDPFRSRAAIALETLRKRSANLDQAIAGADLGSDETVADILDHCVQTANDVAEILAEDLAEDGPFAAVQEDAQEAAGVLLLMQLERGHGPAADAVTLLLQLRRTLAVSLAA